jgi:hypothetical protein
MSCSHYDYELWIKEQVMHSPNYPLSYAMTGAGIRDLVIHKENIGFFLINTVRGVDNIYVNG